MANEPQNYWQPEQPEQPEVIQPVETPQYFQQPQSPLLQPAQPVAQPLPETQVPQSPVQPSVDPAVQQELEPDYDEVEEVASEPLSTEDTPDNPPITWTAQEYVHIDKGPWWYILFSVFILGFIALDILVLKSWTLSVLVVVMAVALIVYIKRPPRMLTYGLSPRQGLYVGEQLYTFEQFKAFGVVRDGEHDSILLIPRKRFAPGVSVFFPEDAGERIVDILGQQLPMETLKLDLVDIIVRKLRL